MSVHVTATGRAEVRPIRLSERFRQEIPYFAADPPAGSSLAEGEWCVDPDEARRLMDAGVLRLVSPLDSDSSAEIELSEEQEEFLDWVVTNDVRRVRLT